MRQIRSAGPAAFWWSAGVVLLTAGGPAWAQDGGWGSASQLPTPRRLLAAAVVGEKIFTFGGCGSPCFSPPFHTSTDEETTVEVYDSTTDSWEVRARIPEIFFGGAAAAPGNGKIYLIGGFVTGNVVLEYDPAVDSWTSAAPMPTARHGLAVAVVDGKIYAMGGSDGSAPRNALEVYDPATGSWSVRASMPTARVFLAAAAANGKIYAVGGSPDCCGADQTNAVEVYDPVADTWSTSTPLPAAQQGSAAVGLNGKIYTFGGFIPGTGTLDTTFEYDPLAEVWTSRAAMPLGVDQAPAVQVGCSAHVLGGSVACHCQARDAHQVYQLGGGADLFITKDNRVDVVVPGESVRYVLVAGNLGPAAVEDARVHDRFPESLLEVEWSCTGSGGARCPSDGGGGDIDERVDLPVGGQLRYVVRAVLDPAATGRLVNRAHIQPPAGCVGDFDLTNNWADDDDPILTTGDVDLSIKNSNGTNRLSCGSAPPYTVRVRNKDTSQEVRGARVRSHFEPPLSGVSWTCEPASPGASCTAAGDGGIDDKRVDLPAGGSVVYTVRLNNPLPGISELTHIARVLPPAGHLDRDSTNDRDVDTDPVDGGSTDLAVTKKTELNDCGVVSYTLGVSNSGSCPVSGALVTDDLLSSFESVSWSCEAEPGAECTTNGSGDIMDQVTLPEGKKVTYSITGTLASYLAHGDPLVNTATVKLPADVEDLNPQNNSFSVEDLVNKQTDLAVTKSNGIDEVCVGDTSPYVISITNKGGCPASGATVTDLFPSELNGVKWECAPSPGAGCSTFGEGDISDQVVLPVGGTVTYTVVEGVVGPGDTLDNEVWVEPPSGWSDPMPDDNHAADSDLILYGADLYSLKENDSEVVNACDGKGVYYEITIGNLGPCPVLGASVEDHFSMLLTNVAWTCEASPAATCAAGNGQVLEDLVDLPAGGSVLYTVTADVGGVGKVENAVTVAPPEGVEDPNLDNNEAMETDWLTLYPDCNSNKQCDAQDILDGISMDVNLNTKPDECEVGGMPQEIPTLSGWGLFCWIVLLLGAAIARLSGPRS